MPYLLWFFKELKHYLQRWKHLCILLWFLNPLFSGENHDDLCFGIYQSCACFNMIAQVFINKQCNILFCMFKCSILGIVLFVTRTLIFFPPNLIVFENRHLALSFHRYVKSHRKIILHFIYLVACGWTFKLFSVIHYFNCCCNVFLYFVCTYV